MTQVEHLQAQIRSMAKSSIRILKEKNKQIEELRIRIFELEKEKRQCKNL